MNKTNSFLIAITIIFSSLFANAADTPDSLNEVKVVSAEETKKLVDSGTPIFDVRVASEFAEEHIKGAVSLPYSEKSKKEVGFDASTDKFDDSKLPAAKMILHCNGKECWKSYKAAVWAHKKGKKEIYWFRDGFPSWKAKGFPIEK